MSDLSFEYDVFVSFSSEDQGLVRPIWQDLMSGGLRVFWSDSNLRERLGSSWYDVIEQSLNGSRHFLLICTRTSLASTWVRREYKAFVAIHDRQQSRLLVPVFFSDTGPNDLPPFLKEFEGCFFRDADLSKRLIRLFGGVDVPALQARVGELNVQVAILREDRDALESQLLGARERLQTQTLESRAARDQLAHVLQERDSLATEIGSVRELLKLRDDTKTRDVLKNDLTAARIEIAHLQSQYDDSIRRNRLLQQEVTTAKQRESTGLASMSSSPQLVVATLPPQFEASAQAFLNSFHKYSPDADGKDGLGWRLAYVVGALIVANGLLSVILS